MCENFDYSVKLGSVFTAIREIDLPIDEFDLLVCTCNSLHKGGITELQQILA